MASIFQKQTACLRANSSIISSTHLSFTGFAAHRILTNEVWHADVKTTNPAIVFTWFSVPESSAALRPPRPRVRVLCPRMEASPACSASSIPLQLKLSDQWSIIGRSAPQLTTSHRVTHTNTHTETPTLLFQDKQQAKELIETWQLLPNDLFLNDMLTEGRERSTRNPTENSHSYKNIKILFIKSALVLKLQKTRTRMAISCNVFATIP